MRTFHLLQHLSQNHSVTLATQVSPQISSAEVSALRQVVNHLATFPTPDPNPSLSTSSRKWLGKLDRFTQFLRQGTPPNVLHHYSPALQAWLDDQIQTHPPQAITCEHSANEIYIRPQWQTQFTTVVNIHSSVYGTCRNLLQTQTAENPLREQLNLPLLYRYEKRYCAKFSQIVVTTDEDRSQIQALRPDKPVTVIPNGVDLARFPYHLSDPNQQNLVFIGAMDNLANIDAACFLGQAIFPKLKQRYPQATLALVGARPDPKVQSLQTIPGITVTGAVPSMADYLHQATVCVIPMRTGFGIKNKTLEAMAAGTPVVASDRGLEGLRVDQPGKLLRALRANQVDEFVEAIGRLFEDAQLRQQLSTQSRAWIEAEYTWTIAGQRYEQVLTERNSAQF